MQFTFSKDHPNGFKAGAVTNLADSTAMRLVKEGYGTAEEDTVEVVQEPQEPEFIQRKLSAADIKKGVYGDLAKGKKPGDVINVPNPNYKP